MNVLQLGGEEEGWAAGGEMGGRIRLLLTRQTRTHTALPARNPATAAPAAGPTCYSSFATSFDASSDGTSFCANFPGTAIGEIAEYGVNVNALVLGKPLLPADTANGGFVNMTVLSSWQEPVRCTRAWQQQRASLAVPPCLSPSAAGVDGVRLERRHRCALLVRRQRDCVGSFPGH